MLFIFVLLLGGSAVLATEPPADYFVLGLSRCDYDDAWGIHGLWPQWNSTAWPEYCNKSDPLNIKNIESLIPHMNKHWGSCEGNNTKFWDHEWLKHGTCTEYDQFVYFSSALYWYRNMPHGLFCFQNKLKCIIPLDMSADFLLS